MSQGGDYGSGPIRFYNRDAPYYEFTNFYPATVRLDGKDWPTTEHYFQAQKFVGTPFTEVIRQFQRPREAFDLSRNPSVSRWCRKDWDDVKIDVMRKALLAKFIQHKDLRRKLLGTGMRMLIEHSPYDSFWGNGGDDSGQNHLGMLLMELRHDLREGRKGKSFDQVETKRTFHSVENVCRETLLHGNTSGGTGDNDSDPSRGSSSSSSMEYSNYGSEQTGHPNSNSHRNLVQGPGTGSSDLTRAPLHPENGSSPSNVPVVGDLIDLSEDKKPIEESRGEAIDLMTGKVPEDPPAIKPTVISQDAATAGDVMFSHNDPHGQQEDMDTSK